MCAVSLVSYHLSRSSHSAATLLNPGNLHRLVYWMYLNQLLFLVAQTSGPRNNHLHPRPTSARKYLECNERGRATGQKRRVEEFHCQPLSNVGDSFRRKHTAIEQVTRRSLRVIELTGMNNLPLRLDRDIPEWEDLMNDAMLGYWGESWQLACAIFLDILNSAFDIVAWNFCLPYTGRIAIVEDLYLYYYGTCTCDDGLHSCTLGRDQQERSSTARLHYLQMLRDDILPPAFIRHCGDFHRLARITRRGI